MWILPSLSRPNRAKAVAEATPDAPITLRLHWGDPKLDQYRAFQWPSAWTVHIATQMNLVDSLNWAYRNFPAECAYGFIADDVIPKPKKWHTILEAAAGSKYIAYPDDSIHHHALCPHFCIGGDLVRKVGFLALPQLTHNFLDTAWYLLGQHTNRLRYTPEVKFEHLHPIAHKGRMDQVYRQSMNLYMRDEQQFHKWLESKAFRQLVKDLREEDSNGWKNE